MRQNILYFFAFTVFYNAESQEPVAPSLDCRGFQEWVALTQKPLKGKSVEVPLLKDAGFHPKLKSSYTFLVSGHLRQLKKGIRAEFRFESHDLKHQPLMIRELKGALSVWRHKTQRQEMIPVGKKILVWSGARGANELNEKAFPEWSDLVLGPSQKGTIVPMEQGPFSDEGSLFYYPEGVLEVYLRKQPLSGQEMVPTRRLYLWAGGCIEKSYPTPWPRLLDG